MKKEKCSKQSSKTVNKGFTLIELLVVVLIIGILAGIALPQYRRAVDKARFATLMDMTKALASANERFYMVNNRYSTNFTELDVDIPAKRISGYTAYFEGFRCSLIYQRRVECINNNNLKNELEINYVFGDHPLYKNRTLCVAFTDQKNSRYDKLCQDIGIFLTKDNCNEGPCRVYTIR